jgi:hypothetical protein
MMMAGRILSGLVSLFLLVDGEPAWPTGHLGGATATQIRVGDPWWLFPVALGVMAWGGLWLRYPGLREWIPVMKT